MSEKDLQALARFMEKVEKRFIRGAWSLLSLGVLCFLIFDWHVIF